MSRLKNIHAFVEYMIGALQQAIHDCSIEAAISAKNNGIHMHGITIKP